MPGNLTQVEPNGVMPSSLCTAFTELREYAQLQNQYHDGTIQRLQGMSPELQKSWSASQEESWREQPRQ
jgi:hypothetical protein